MYKFIPAPPARRLSSHLYLPRQPGDWVKSVNFCVSRIIHKLALLDSKVYIIHKKLGGPRKDPCGTPATKPDHTEKVSPSITRSYLTLD